MRKIFPRERKMKEWKKVIYLRIGEKLDDLALIKQLGIDSSSLKVSMR